MSVDADCAAGFFGAAFVTGAFFAAAFFTGDFFDAAFFAGAFLAVAFFAGATGSAVVVVVVAAALRLATESATDLAAVATNTARVASRLRVNV